MKTFANHATLTDELSQSECDKIWNAYRRDWNACDTDAILSGFSDDAVVKYGDLDPIEGLAALRSFLQARFARMENYKVDKKLQCFTGNVAGGSFESSWTDLKTGKKMQAWGAEFVAFREGKCFSWICMVNPREIGAPPSIPIM